MTTARANVLSDYVAATRPRSTAAPRPGYPSGALSTRDCALTERTPIGRTRVRIPAPVRVVSGRGTEALREPSRRSKRGLKRTRQRAARKAAR